MAVVLGKNIKIYSGTSGTTPIIAMAKSCAVNMRCDIIEKASESNQTSREYVPGREDWDISLNHLVSSDAPVEGLLKVGGIYTLRLVIGSTTRQGTAICNEANITGTTSNIGTGSIKFKGSGPLASPT